MDAHVLLDGVVGGVFATLVMDLSVGAGRAAGFIQAPFPLPLGRWVAYGARGRIVHTSILDAAPAPGERPAALFSHYAIGATLGTLFAALLAALPTAPPFLAGCLFGTSSSLLPWLLMFPAMGYGLFGRRGPSAAHLLRNSLYSHLFFGAGLGLWAAYLRALL